MMISQSKNISNSNNQLNALNIQPVAEMSECTAVQYCMVRAQILSQYYCR